MRLEQEREQARIAEARRHPDELTQEERLARVRGVGEKTIEQLKGCRVRDGRGHRPRRRTDAARRVAGLGIKKARQIKSAAERYLHEEAKLRAELNAERAKLRARRAPEL